MPHILSVSYDPSLLQTRQAMLQHRGYTVTSALRYDAALRECRAGHYDLVILGHSIPPADKERLVQAVNEHCTAPVLALLKPGQWPIRGATDSVEALHPDEFLEVVERLLTHRSRE